MTVTVLDSLNQALLNALRSDPRVLLLGEDILDPYGGAFKVTRGCSTEFPDRVITTPISEAGLAGVAAGMSMRGLRPVLEIMFGDFVTLMADQLINHISKFRWMYNETVELPLVIRTPMGGRRGYGPTHSQTLEKIYLGVPGLTVLSPASIAMKPDGSDGPEKLLKNAILESDFPVFFVENKLQYLQPVLGMQELAEFEVQVQYEPSDPAGYYPVYHLKIKGAPAPALTLTAYGYMAEMARQAMLKLAYKEEIFTDLVIPTRLAPFNNRVLAAAVSESRRLLTVEEGTYTLGWGAEILARMSEELGGKLQRCSRLAAADLPVPASPALEKEVLPQVEQIIGQARKMV